MVSPSVSFVPSGPTDDIALRHATGGGGGPLQRGLPVRGAHHDFGAVAPLQFRRALIVIAVRVADDDVLDVARVEPQLRSCRR